MINTEYRTGNHRSASPDFFSEHTSWQRLWILLQKHNRYSVVVFIEPVGLVINIQDIK